MDPRSRTPLAPRPGIPRTRGDGPSAAASPCSGRIPRTRGDGPCASSPSRRRPTDSPHPRGWTPASGREPMGALGFPAPAGMDPPAGALPLLRRRIPRTRGDGPASRRARRPFSKDSPHPRGWTPASWQARGGKLGFPAPAGMDRLGSNRRTGGRRIPRTRGDGPSIDSPRSSPASDSPHPRGWTGGLRHHDRLAGGFPAPAGMDPAGGRGGRGIPRTRGDGPSARPPRRRMARDSPHPRGWTLDRQPPQQPRLGFPAPAGMDRRADTRPAPRSRIPRTRGDGPSTSRRTMRCAMDSPHPRGWTLQVPIAVARVRGFPAPAGMDPCASPAPINWAWIPRTRGDGPAAGWRCTECGWDSPHPRGWTALPPGASHDV